MARKLFDRDRAANRPGVYLPHALERKYPNAGATWAWFWVFPAAGLSVDPRSGIERRHHAVHKKSRESPALMITHQGTDGDILINVGPMHADSFSDQSPFLALLLGSVAQSGKPFDGCRNLAAIGKNEVQRRIVDAHVDGMWIKPDCQNTHATSPKTKCDVRSPRRELASIHDF
jgi:hypothetical protein